MPDLEYEEYCRWWWVYLDCYEEKTFRDRFNRHVRRGWEYKRLPGNWPEVSVALGGEHPVDRLRFIAAMEDCCTGERPRT